MISYLHRLREDEEGQTLVLAALFGLILALSVLGTVNLGRAVYDKMQLQTACDNGAYSQAAVEARVLNYTAYTNRAMVVHYASIMAMSAYLTWLHFNWAFLKGALTLAKLIPPITAIANALDQVLSTIVKILDYAVAIATPIIAAANFALYGFQEAAWTIVWAGRLSTIPPEAHSGDSTGHPYKPIWPKLIPLANMAVFSQARGHTTMFQNTAEAFQVFLNAKNPVVQQARLHMIEVANSARIPWVAYGDKWKNPSLSPFARHFKWPFLCAEFGKNARTELGSYKPGNGLGIVAKATGQVWSADRLEADYDCFWPIGSGKLTLFGVAMIGDLFKLTRTSAARTIPMGSGKWFIKLILGVIGGLAIFKAMDTFAKSTFPTGTPIAAGRPFFISPYVYFSPQAHATPRGGFLGQLGNFAQPDVVFGLAREGLDYNREEGAQKLYGHKFSFNGKGAGTGSVDFAYEAKDTPRIPGLPSILHQGFNTFCAAQVYYHRPGDWREMPNLFNPLWGARLMPVMESNAAAALGITRTPGLGALLQH